MVSYGPTVMKQWRLPVLGLLLAVLACFLAHHVWQQHERNKREVRYQSVLHSYTEALKPGMRRVQVEDYLRAKNVRFQKLCCDGRAYTDWILVDLRRDDVPWYCSEVSVFIELQFDRSEPLPKVSNILNSSPEPSDSLKKIELISRGEGCL